MVGPRPRIPAELTRRPFSLEEARAAGISRTSLSGRSWRRLGAHLYCWSGLADDPWKLLSAWLRLLPEAVFAGATAAWLHGIGLDPIHPVEVFVSSRSGLRSRAGLSVRRSDIARCDVAKVRGLPATTINRTLADLCCRLSAVETLAAIDAAVRLRLVDAALCRTGTHRMRHLAALAEPAESPMDAAAGRTAASRGPARPPRRDRAIRRPSRPLVPVLASRHRVRRQQPSRPARG
jgi:hypothetical protein